MLSLVLSVRLIGSTLTRAVIIMLQIEIIDGDCGDDEAHKYEVPLDTTWDDIQTMVRLIHPTCTSCTISVTEDKYPQP